MTTTPLISVIMPVFNKQPYIRKAVESVLAQREENWELIIIDDGSTDGSIDQVPVDGRIRIFTQPNRGPSAARNLGIQESIAPLITFLDADDCYYPDKLAKDVHYLLEKNMADWMVSGCHKASGDEMEAPPFLDIHGNALPETPSTYADTLKELTLKAWPSNGICAKRSLVESAGGFSQDMRCFEITDFVYKLALKQPRVFILPEATYKVVDVPRSAFKNSVDRIDGVRILAEKCKQYGSQHPEYKSILLGESARLFRKYSAFLISDGREKEARRILSGNSFVPFDYAKLKLYVKTFVPRKLRNLLTGVSRSLQKIAH